MPSLSGHADERRQLWDRRYAGAGVASVSWYQPEPATSLALIDRLRIPKGAPIIDVGGGTSLLVDRLLAQGYTDLAVLDVSSTALEIARRRVGASAPVRWLRDDITTWHPDRRYALWHDRAVFHFLTREPERASYLTIMRNAVDDPGAVIMATFGSDGPERCSGLPVARYDARDLEELLGGFMVIESRNEDHVTPSGAIQPFTWIAAARDYSREAA